MPDFTNIVTVDLTEATGYNVEAHRAVHQWDSGVILQLTGATFPQGTTCQFDTKTTTFNQELTDGACEIPNALLGYDMIGDIKAHVKIDDDDYGIVVYDIHIPVIRRPKPDSYIYTDNTSSENGWIKTDNGFKVNEGQTFLGRTELSINDNQTILDGTSLSLNNQQTVLDGTHLSLASGLFYADSTGITFASGAFQAEGDKLRLNSGRITIGPNKMLVDDRVFGTCNLIDMSSLEQGAIDSGGVDVSVTTYIRTSQYIPVKPNTAYTFSSNLNPHTSYFWEYASTKAYLRYGGGSIQSSSQIYTTGANTAYLRINFGYSPLATITLSDVAWCQLEESPVVSPFVPYALDNVELTNRRFVQDWESRNILDQALIEQGALDGSTGDMVDWNARIRSEFTPIKPNTTYTVSYMGDAFPCMFYYSSTKAYVTCELSIAIVTSYTFTSPSGAAFVKFTWGKSGNASISPSDISNIQLEKRRQASLYIPFAETNIELSDKARRILQTYEPLIADGKNIPTNVNLNTISYCNVGRYVCPLSTTPPTLVNCPTTNAFYMTVRNVTKTDIPTSTLTWQYLLREITDVNGNQYTQTAFCGGTAGSWVFGVWKQIIAGRKTGTLTANTGSFSESYCRQSGDTVDIHGWLERLSTSIQSHENAVTVSGVSLPSVPVRFVFTCWLGNNIAAYAGYGVLDTTGKITFVKAVANSDKVSFTISYIV